MHELALAEAVITAALAEADRNGIGPIDRISVRIGELQQIEQDTFDYCLRQVRPGGGDRFTNTEILLGLEPAQFTCRLCAQSFSLSQGLGPKPGDESEAVHFIPELVHAFVRCPACDSSDFEIVAGRGITLASVEGELASGEGKEGR